jgi:hypothetical protein
MVKHTEDDDDLVYKLWLTQIVYYHSPSQKRYELWRPGDLRGDSFNCSHRWVSSQLIFFLDMLLIFLYNSIVKVQSIWRISQEGRFAF